jgi:EmrB/QacA subfamily drug resistance transporter
VVGSNEVVTRESADPRRSRALTVLLLGQFAALLDVSVTNVALPSIGRATGSSPSELQWIVTGYVLAFGLMPIIGGRLGDDRGRRRIFIIGLIGFVISSAAVGLSPDPLFMIIARVVQGLFGGVLGPQISGYIQNAFPREERGRAFGQLGLTVGVATALGPVLGGLLIALGGPDFGWRLVFFINVPIGITAILLSLAWVRESALVRAGPRTKLDTSGALLLGVGILCMLFPIVEFDTFHSPWPFLLMLPGAMFAVLFIRRERRLTDAEASPLLDLRLFKQPSFTIGVAFILLYFGGSTGLPLVLTLYLQQGIGFEPVQAALAVTALAVGSAISAPIAGRLVSRIGRPLVVGGVTLFIIGAVGVTFVISSAPHLTNSGTIILHLALPLFLIGVATGAVITPNQALSLADVDRSIAGSAGGVLQTSQRVGAAIGQAVIGTIFFAAVSGTAASTALGTPSIYPPVYADALGAGVVGALLFSAAALVLGIADLAGTRWRKKKAAEARAVPCPAQ